MERLVRQDPSSRGPLLIQAKALSVTIKGKPILERINLQLHGGEILTLIGPNGAGKSTLVQTILGIRSATTGDIQRKPGIRIGYVPQRVHVEPTIPLTVHRFLTLAQANPGRLQACTELTGIGHLLRHELQTVSGGEFQRILLARALMSQPELLVLDEPAQGIDLGGQEELYQLIDNLRVETGCAVLMISHDLHLVMAATDTVICLNRHICCSGHPEVVSRDPAFLSLFGNSASHQMAFYSHHHDHSHNLHGDIIQQGKAPKP